jgi:hypothetical protein
MLKLAVFAGMLITVSPAVAQTQVAAPTNAAKPAQAKSDDPNRVICETEQQIGSRLASKRICMTASQWMEHELQAHDQIDQLHMQTQSTPGPG